MGGREPSELTWGLGRAKMDDYVLVDDSEFTVLARSSNLSEAPGFVVE